jgi:GNAT superfamily N-acetyltransferase
VTYRLVTISERTDLAPVVAGWFLEVFRHARSPSQQVLTARLLAQSKRSEETFVLIADDVPVGTASFVINDLPSRPDLTPWLASVLVRPQFRGRGYSVPLIQHVEAVAAAASVPTLWLYTWSAEPLYARLGWQRVGVERDADRDIEVVLMNRQLASPL